MCQTILSLFNPYSSVERWLIDVLTAPYFLKRSPIQVLTRLKFVELDRNRCFNVIPSVATTHIKITRNAIIKKNNYKMIIMCASGSRNVSRSWEIRTTAWGQSKINRWWAGTCPIKLISPLADLLTGNLFRDRRTKRDTYLPWNIHDADRILKGGVPFTGDSDRAVVIDVSPQRKVHS